MHVPSFQAGPRARALTRMARTPRSRPRSGWPHAPVPDSDGPSAPGPVLLPRTAPRHGAQEPYRTITTGPVPARANPTRSAIVDVLAAAPSRCRHVQPVGPINRWATDRTGGERLPRVRQAPRRLRHIANSLAGPQPMNYPRATQRHEPSAGGEGLPQTTPLLSVRGCKWGPTPLSSMNTVSHTSVMPCSKTARDTPEGGS